MGPLNAVLALHALFLVHAVPRSFRLPGEPTPHPGTVYNFFFNNQTTGPESFDADNADFDLLRHLFIYAEEGALLKSTGRENRGITLFTPTDEALIQSARDIREVFKLADTELPTAERAAWDVYEAWFRTMDNPKATMSRILRFHVVIDERYTRDQLISELPDPRLNTSTGEPVLLSGTTLGNGDERFVDPQLTMNFEFVMNNGILHPIDRMLFPHPNNQAADPQFIPVEQTPSVKPQIPTESTEAEGDDTVHGNPAPSPGNQASDLTNSAQSDSASCFPASSFVHLDNGSTLPISQLSTGHVIMSSTKERVSSPVYLFSHREHETMHDFVRITCQRGYKVTLTGGHYLYANGRRTAANRVRLGDALYTVDGVSIVTGIAKVRGRGLYAPHTLHGDLVVDGILVSSYTTAVSPRVAHMLLWPFRMLVRAGFAVEPLGGLLYHGSPRLAALLPSGADVY